MWIRQSDSEKKKSMTKLVPRTNTSDVNSTYGSFQFDDTLKLKDVSLVSKLRDLVERMDFMEKSVMVRLDRIEKRLTRPRRRRTMVRMRMRINRKEMWSYKKSRCGRTTTKVKSVVKQKLKVVRKRKDQQSERKRRRVRVKFVFTRLYGFEKDLQFRSKDTSSCESG